MSVSDTLIDTLFDGRYRIVRRLGAGGMANVYLAEDQELGRRVAIKILNDRHANDDQFVERFRREAKSAAGLSHPNIVSIYDRGEAEGTYYIAMEHLDGRNLKELIVARGPAPVRIAIEYTPPDPRRAQLRAPARDRAPRRQAAQRAGRRRRPPQGDRLRDRPRGRQPDDRDRLDRRARRSTCRRSRRAAGRSTSARTSTRVGRRALRAADRRRPVHRRQPGRDRDEAPLDDAIAAVDPAAGHPARPRPRRHARAGEGFRRPLPDGGGDGRRPGARGARLGREHADRRGRDRDPGGARDDADRDHASGRARRVRACLHAASRLLRPGRAPAPAAADLAVAARPDPARQRRRGRGVRLGPDPVAAEPERAGRRAVRRRASGGPGDQRPRRSRPPVRGRSSRRTPTRRPASSTARTRRPGSGSTRRPMRSRSSSRPASRRRWCRTSSA